MNQAQCWMWRKQGHENLDDSWEERAFAEDAAGLLGGCVWPPRSYTCSFCKREFRSAQALGGHMNVHRRDRARLKQFTCPQNNTIQHPHHNIGSYGDNQQQTKQGSTLAHNNPNPFSHSSTDLGVGPKQIPSPHLPSCLVASSEKNLPLRRKNIRFHCDIKELGCKNKEHDGESSLCINLNFNRDCSKVLADEEDAPTNRKRRKLDVSSELVMPIVTVEDKVNEEHSKAYDVKSSSLEELDLELRLGDRPKVL